MTLPAKKYRSWKTRERIGNLKLGLILSGIFSVLALLIMVRIDGGWTIQHFIFAYLSALLILGVVLGLRYVLKKWSRL